MPRRTRVLIEGGTYNVYQRVAIGERAYLSTMQAACEDAGCAVAP